MSLQAVNPKELGAPKGYSNGILAPAGGRLLFVAGQVGRDKEGRLVSKAFPVQFGQALANVYACIEEGVRVADASVAGLGGCPYAKGATGNVATEDLVYMLHGLGLETGVDLDALCDTARWISAELGREPASRVAKARPRVN